ncbi:MAG TPA: PIG-L family deacetylase [Thermoanaerobaculia bacterium]|jgi:LmbE family N-acetylglucosaminyl deacetylase|nr:PIG-L family deacetylase [Thermoanaerobaculia bacterium]
MRLIALLIALFGVCESSAARVRAVRPWLPRPERVLVIVAHPDDELLLAPYLASRCVRGGATCSILVLTRGEGGGDPDVRSGEMARAAALLNSRLTQWSLPDVMTQWSDRETLVRQLADVIALENPDMILTFDPAHGTTGHPAHRQTGALVLETGAPNVYLLETLAQFVGAGFVLSPAREDVWAYDPGADWEYAVRLAEIHASQFSGTQVESLRTLPIEQRRVWLMRGR